MKAEKIGIWMDHQQAWLTEFTTPPMKTTCIRSDHHSDQHTHHGEQAQHVKEQHQQTDFYTAIAAVIRSYKTVLLYGPTTAKTELLHRIRKDHSLDSISIQLKDTDKMTEGEQHAFIRSHFERH